MQYGALQPTPNAPATVLVVDDNAASRYATSRVIQEAGFRVLETAGGAEALELVRQATAVVLDVHLPDLHGFEVCRLIRSDPATATLPVVHVSAVYVSPDDRAAGLLRGADAYLLSPVEPVVLVATLSTLIQARSGDQQLRQRESRYRSLFEQSPAATVLVDAAGDLAEVNEAFATLVGHDRATLPGLPLSDLAPREDRAAVRETVGGWAHAPWSGQFTVLKGRSSPLRLHWNVSHHAEAGFAIAVASEAPPAARAPRRAA
jgi:PAS domain S-box-containing protein